MVKMNSISPFILGFNGTTLGKELTSHLKKINPAGVILFKRNIETIDQTRSLVSDLKGLLGEIIIAVDHEGGLVNRFPEDCPVPPAPLALAGCGDMGVVRGACRMQAELLSYLGFNMNFVPLVDLALFSENQVIGTRAFSSEPNDVAAFAQICIEEHHKLNIATCAKHFPTHGRSITDSHFAVGSSKHESHQQLEQDLIPYKSAIHTGVPTIMAAHLTFPLLDNELPASLSHPILQELLRNQLGFNGLIISDCVEMEGLSRNFTPQEIIEKGLVAGVDLFISSFSLKKSMEYQEQLYSSYQSLVDKDPAISQNLTRGLSAFQKRFFEQKCQRVEKIADLEDAIALHRKTLIKTRKAEIKQEFKQFYLVELTALERQGINEGNQWNMVSEMIQKHCHRYAGGELINQFDAEVLSNIVLKCNQEQLTIVLLSSNCFRREGYTEAIQILKDARSAIHIALLDSADLTKCFANEWTTQGYNACTGLMLAEELNTLS